MISDKKNIKILVAGEGGQGVQVIAQILAKAAFDEGKQVLYIPNFGVEQRGGVSIAFLQISTSYISAPKFEKSDYHVILSNRSYERTKSYISEDTVVISDKDIVSEAINEGKVYKISAAKISNEELNPRVFNMIFLGALLRFNLMIDENGVIESMNQKFAEKYESKPELKSLNEKAIIVGKTSIKNEKI